MNVLFLNHKIKACGVYQYGVRLYDILKKSSDINYIYKEIENYNEYCQTINENTYNAIFYNYHFMTMPWLNANNIRKDLLNINTQHDLEEYSIFNITVRLDTTLKESPNKYNIPRPIYENVDKLLETYTIKSNKFQKFIDYKKDSVPVFGSFGFADHRKGFDKVIQYINNTFDNAIIKILMPGARFLAENLVTNILNTCSSIKLKPGIELLITHEFVENEDILMFLKSNDQNIFLYDHSHPHSGVSSVIDYALSVKKPIIISDSHWFRHIYSDDICITKNNINHILEHSLAHVNKMCDLFSNKHLIDKIDTIIKSHIV